MITTSAEPTPAVVTGGSPAVCGGWVAAGGDAGAGAAGATPGGGVDVGAVGAGRIVAGAVVVVPGTGELAGITGRFTLNIVDGKHFYEFDYSLLQ